MTAVFYLLCAFIWGTTWFAIRASIGVGGYPTYAAAALRFTLAAVILGGLWRAGLARPGPRTRREVAWLVVAGLLNAGSYALVYTAEERIPGGLAAVLYGTAPLMMAGAALATRAERVSPAAVIGALVALGGIVVIFWDRLQVSGPQAAGVVMMLGSVALSTVYNLIFKRHARDQHPLASTGVFLAVTAAALWVFAAIVERRAPPWPAPAGPTVAIAYLGVIGSVVAFASYFALLKRVRLMTVSTLVFLQPVIALSADALFEHQVRLVARSYVGVAIVFCGVAIGVVTRPRSRP